MSLPEIQMLWVRGALSTLEQLAIVSFMHNGHPVRLFSYEPIPNLPQETIWEDARAIMPESAIFANPASIGYGGLTAFSNFFRYKLLLERGGIWSDCDSVCVKPLIFANEMEYFFATERVPGEQNGPPGVRLASCLFKAPPGSAVVARALEIAQATDIATSPWGSTGPRALHQAVIDSDLKRYMLTPEACCPIDWWQFPALVSGLTVLPANAHAVHFWSEMWRRNFLDKNADYGPLSIFERLKAHYLRRQGAADA